MTLVLASASPRREQLLRAAGYRCEVRPVVVDEGRLAGEAPAAYVERVAWAKARASVAAHPARVVVAADTAVVIGADVLGKPADATDAARMLRVLAGRAHRVLTGVVVIGPAGGASRVASTTVWMSPLSEADIAWYVTSGEPFGKAGGYAIQGLASRFIPRIDGSYANVVGLPITALRAALAEIAAGEATPGSEPGVEGRPSH